MVNKKAVFFTFTAILMMSVFLISFFVYNEYRMRNRALVLETRISSMDDFIQDIKVDIERGLYISSFRSILSLTEYVTLNKSYVDNVNSAFNEVFFNGTVNDQEMSLIKNNTFPIWEGRVEEQAKKTDIDIYFYNETVNIDQTSPWKVRITLDFTLGVGDIRSTAYWTKDMSIETYVNITNFEDPIYRIKTNGLVLNAIKPKNVAFFVNQTTNSTTNLESQANGSYYIAWTNAPSFLKRLEGDLSADPNGIESLVNIQKLTDQGLVPGLLPQNKTPVDYIYFNERNNPTSWKIKNMPTWFRIDNQTNNQGNQTHLQIYEVAGLTI
jgi:hypothetical protein